jgi:hypothetical protein
MLAPLKIYKICSHVIVYRSWWQTACRISKYKTFWAVFLLVLAVSTSSVLFVTHYTGQNENEITVKNQGKVFM